MPVQGDFVPIIKPRTPQRAVIHPKTRYSDDMQRRIRCGTQTRDIARIRRYLGLVQCDMKHGQSVKRKTDNGKLKTRLPQSYPLSVIRFQLFQCILSHPEIINFSVTRGCPNAR